MSKKTKEEVLTKLYGESFVPNANGLTIFSLSTKDLVDDLPIGDFNPIQKSFKKEGSENDK